MPVVKQHNLIFTQEELTIIESAVNNALCFGTGILSTCIEQLEDAGYPWDERYETYIFNKYIEGDGKP